MIAEREEVASVERAVGIVEIGENVEIEGREGSQERENSMEKEEEGE